MTWIFMYKFVSIMELSFRCKASIVCNEALWIRWYKTKHGQRGAVNSDEYIKPKA